ncbi:uncharacterized protein SPPG_03149 [Spizellomyces punctatus DAOM BR117]|uniref:NADH dehydrogenase [ubiquinone] 1 beta subcomplex subunit 9 n=1 Tax=Spizellomyces punctatus (strain DAOM BR117) TaxID=645134 RepID=A0A0L0HJN7_SPIPD|nr:uncharacterized protein SPPG_03149 [Spizellomyces punctatus DAOM BR117]KND01337.1 hypothetical protein SPPG_03149 [Spizellomyces punctatus DAOM BR117]|eukprot:XP_016609376.1 hypothetical protein SPPG_03149 [Spizellomyces punctatus DAOM BR117]
MAVPDPETIPSLSYFPFPKEVARNMFTEVRSIAAGLGTNGLAEHADKIEAGLNRMGSGMDSAGKSIKTGLVVVGIGLGIGLTVIEQNKLKLISRACLSDPVIVMAVVALLPHSAMMNSVVTTPVQLGTAAHRIYVTRLYRRSLRLAADWYWQRAEFREKALIIRHLFEQNRNNPNPKEIEKLIARTELMLATYHHPQPYYNPTAPGGSKWERNIPFPEELVKRGVTPFDNCS